MGALGKLDDVDDLDNVDKEEGTVNVAMVAEVRGEGGSVETETIKVESHGLRG